MEDRTCTNEERERAYLIDEHISVDNYEDAAKLMDILIRNDYICILSREERLYIIQFTWAPNADRNYLEVFNYA